MWLFLTLSWMLAAQEVWDVEVDSKNYVTPTKRLATTQMPVFSDDYDMRGMLLAVDRQITRLRQKKLTGTIKMGADLHPLKKVLTSLEVFRGIILEFDRCVARESRRRCFGDLNKTVSQKFHVYVPDLKPEDPRYGEENNAFFTGYHTMQINAKTKPDAEYKHAIYANPGDSRLYYTREEIDFLGALKGRGLEIAYVKSLFDIYLLHVQGSGKITLVDKNNRPSHSFYLNYDGTNKKKWEFISHYMIQQGYITSHSVPAQRRFLNHYPELQQSIFANCPSYVWTKVTNQPPLGNDNVSVTDGRSIATDSTLYAFKGLITYVEASRPMEDNEYDLEEEDSENVDFIPFSRFFLDQDTGGAIKGKARADIYFGEDTYAYFAAMHMKQLGKIHFLMVK